MGPPSHRTIFIQPENHQSSSINKNPLDGDLTFHASNPLIVKHQEWKSGSWITVEISTAESLSEAMRKTCEHECLQSPEGMPSLGSVTGILNYDLVQWTSPVGIKHIPSSNSVLGIMYRISGYIFHNRSTNKIYLVADENHPWSNITDIFPQEYLNNPFLSMEMLNLQQIQIVIILIKFVKSSSQYEEAINTK